MSDVIIVGAGPVGLMLAAELRLGGVDVLVLEKLDAPTGLSKALAITGCGEDYLAMRGLLERFRQRAPATPPTAGLLHYALIPLDITKTALAPKGVFVPQAITEEILEERARELGATIRRSVTVTALAQDEGGVTVDAIEHGRTIQLRARYVVGCDGARSVVRHLADIEFSGLEATSLLRLGDVKLDEGAPAPPMLIPLGEGWFRLITMEPMPPDFDAPEPMELDELRASAARVFHLDLPLREARWLSRFTDATRQAETYRRARVFVAGDAAHIQLPAGGPGLLTGLGDALNLGWKLAAVVRADAPSASLDSYHAERHPVGVRVLAQARAQGRLLSADEAGAALRATIRELVEIPDVVRHLLRMLWQLDTRYCAPNETSHPLVGTFLPDATIATSGGRPTPIITFLRSGRWLAIETSPTFDARVDRLGATRVVGSRIDGAGDVCALLIRPDGYVAWAGAAQIDARDQADLGKTIGVWLDQPIEEIIVSTHR